ncbi:MAG: nuclear transport factor 2 family protein [Gemmatimonadota bacterium]|nr:nuclear transport factor 2 family protein [Gemmatimonadota bacterium]
MTSSGPQPWLPVLFVLLLGSACAPGPDGETQDAPPEDLPAQVARQLDAYLADVATRDAEGLRSAYVPDERFAWIEDGAVAYRAVGDVLAGLAAFSPGTAIVTELEGLEVVPIGADGAHSWAQFRTTIGEGEGAFSFAGMMSMVWERDGERWRIVGGHTSSPRSPPGS